VTLHRGVNEALRTIALHVNLSSYASSPADDGGLDAHLTDAVAYDTRQR
jgi:hypothetical protein